MLDLSYLTEEEQRAILKVLKRDADLKQKEEDRCKILKKEVEDEKKLKVLTGEWFYEVKGKRHDDRLHGSDLVRASMRKGKSAPRPGDRGKAHSRDREDKENKHKSLQLEDCIANESSAGPTEAGAPRPSKRFEGLRSTSKSSLNQTPALGGTSASKEQGTSSSTKNSSFESDEVENEPNVKPADAESKPQTLAALAKLIDATDVAEVQTLLNVDVAPVAGADVSSGVPEAKPITKGSTESTKSGLGERAAAVAVAAAAPPVPRARTARPEVNGRELEETVKPSARQTPVKSAVKWGGDARPPPEPAEQNGAGDVSGVKRRPAVKLSGSLDSLIDESEDGAGPRGILKHSSMSSSDSSLDTPPKSRLTKAISDVHLTPEVMHEKSKSANEDSQGSTEDLEGRHVRFNSNIQQVEVETDFNSPGYTGEGNLDNSDESNSSEEEEEDEEEDKETEENTLKNAGTSSTNPFMNDEMAGDDLFKDFGMDDPAYKSNPFTNQFVEEPEHDLPSLNRHLKTAASDDFWAEDAELELPQSLDPAVPQRQPKVNNKSEDLLDDDSENEISSLKFASMQKQPKDAVSNLKDGTNENQLPSLKSTSVQMQPKIARSADLLAEDDENELPYSEPAGLRKPAKPDMKDDTGSTVQERVPTDSSKKPRQDGRTEIQKPPPSSTERSRHGDPDADDNSDGDDDNDEQRRIDRAGGDRQKKFAAEPLKEPSQQAIDDTGAVPSLDSDEEGWQSKMPTAQSQTSSLERTGKPKSLQYPSEPSAKTNIQASDGQQKGKSLDATAEKASDSAFPPKADSHKDSTKSGSRKSSKHSVSSPTDESNSRVMDWLLQSEDVQRYQMFVPGPVMVKEELPQEAPKKPPRQVELKTQDANAEEEEEQLKVAAVAGVQQTLPPGAAAAATTSAAAATRMGPKGRGVGDGLSLEKQKPGKRDVDDFTRSDVDAAADEDEDVFANKSSRRSADVKRKLAPDAEKVHPKVRGDGELTMVKAKAGETVPEPTSVDLKTHSRDSDRNKPVELLVDVKPKPLPGSTKIDAKSKGDDDLTVKTAKSGKTDPELKSTDLNIQSRDSDHNKPAELLVDVKSKALPSSTKMDTKSKGDDDLTVKTAKAGKTDRGEVKPNDTDTGPQGGDSDGKKSAELLVDVKQKPSPDSSKVDGKNQGDGDLTVKKSKSGKTDPELKSTDLSIQNRDSDHNKPAELLVDVKSKASPSSTKMDTKSRGDGDVTVKTAKAGTTDPFELKFTGVHAQNRDSDGNKPAELLADVKQKPSPDGVKLEAKNKDDGVLTAKKTKVGKTDVGKLKPNHAETDAQPGDSDHNIKDIKHTGPSDDVKMGLKNKHGDSNAEKTKLEKSRKNASDNSMFMDVDTFTQPDESTDGEPADATNKNKFVISSSKAASSAKLHGETIFPDKQRLSVKDMKDHWEKANRSDKGNITTATAAGYVKDHLNVSDSDAAINDGAEESGATASVEKNDAKLFSREKISPEKSRMNIDEAAYQVEQSKQPKPKCSSESVDLSTPAKPMSAGEKEGVEPGKESGRPGRASLQRQTSSESEASSAGDGPDGSFKIFSGRQRMKDGSQELHGRSTKFKDLHDFWTKDTKERKKVKGDLYDEEDRKPKSPTGAPSPQSVDSPASIKSATKSTNGTVEVGNVSPQKMHKQPPASALESKDQRAEQGKQQNTSSDRPESESGRQGELSREPSKSQKEAEKQLVEKAVPAEQETSVSPDKTRVKSGPRTKTELPAKIGAELSLKNVVLSPNTDERQRLEERAQELEEQDPGVQLKPQKTVESSQTTTANRAKTEKKPMAKEPSERVRLPFGTEAKPDVKERIQDLFECDPADDIPAEQERSCKASEPGSAIKKTVKQTKPAKGESFEKKSLPANDENLFDFNTSVQLPDVSSIKPSSQTSSELESPKGKPERAEKPVAKDKLEKDSTPRRVGPLSFKTRVHQRVETSSSSPSNRRPVQGKTTGAPIVEEPTPVKKLEKSSRLIEKDPWKNESPEELQSFEARGKKLVESNKLVPEKPFESLKIPLEVEARREFKMKVQELIKNDPPVVEPRKEKTPAKAVVDKKRVPQRKDEDLLDFDSSEQEPEEEQPTVAASPPTQTEPEDVPKKAKMTEKPVKEKPFESLKIPLEVEARREFKMKVQELVKNDPPVVEPRKEKTPAKPVVEKKRVPQRKDEDLLDFDSSEQEPEKEQPTVAASPPTQTEPEDVPKKAKMTEKPVKEKPFESLKIPLEVEARREFKMKVQELVKNDPPVVEPRKEKTPAKPVVEKKRVPQRKDEDLLDFDSSEQEPEKEKPTVAASPPTQTEPEDVPKKAKMTEKPIKEKPFESLKIPLEVEARREFKMKVQELVKNDPPVVEPRKEKTPAKPVVEKKRVPQRKDEDLLDFDSSEQEPEKEQPTVAASPPTQTEPEDVPKKAKMTEKPVKEKPFESLKIPLEVEARREFKMKVQELVKNDPPIVEPRKEKTPAKPVVEKKRVPQRKDEDLLDFDSSEQEPEKEQPTAAASPPTQTEPQDVPKKAKTTDKPVPEKPFKSLKIPLEVEARREFKMKVQELVKNDPPVVEPRKEKTLAKPVVEKKRVPQRKDEDLLDFDSSEQEPEKEQPTVAASPPTQTEPQDVPNKAKMTDKPVKEKPFESLKIPLEVEARREFKMKVQELVKNDPPVVEPRKEKTPAKAVVDKKRVPQRKDEDVLDFDSSEQEPAEEKPTAAASSPTQTEPEDVPKKAKVTDKPVSEKPFQSLKIPLEVEARREFKMKVQELVKNDPPVVEPRKEKTSAKPVVEKKQVSQRKDEDVLDFDSSEQEPEEEQPTASPPTQVKDVLKDSDNTYNKKHPDRPQDLNKRDPFAEAEQEVELEQSHSPPVEASDLFLKMKDLPKGRRLPDKTRQDPEDNSEKHNIQLLKGRPHELARINSDDDSFEKPSKIQSKDVRDAPPQPPRRPVEKRKEKAAMPPKSSDEETLPQRAKEQVKHGHKAADPRALSEEDKEPPSPVPEKRRPKEPSSADVTVAQNRPQGRQKSLPETTDQEATWSDDPEIGQMNRKEEVGSANAELSQSTPAIYTEINPAEKASSEKRPHKEPMSKQSKENIYEDPQGEDDDEVPSLPPRQGKLAGRNPSLDVKEVVARSAVSPQVERWLEDATAATLPAAARSARAGELTDAERKKQMSRSVPVLTVSGEEGEQGIDIDSEDSGSFKLRRAPSDISSISGSMMSLYSDAGDYGNVDVKGEVNFALKYDDRRSELHVCVAQCRDLAAAVAKKGRSDPYVKTYLLPDKSRQSKKKTGIRKNNLNPVYNEILKYKIPARELQSRVLNLSVWHNDKFGKNSFLGEVEMELSTWDWGNTAYNWFDLQPRVHISQEDLTSRGYLNLALKFIPANSVGQFTPASGEIHIWVKEAKNLLPLKPHGVDAFVKCYILPDLSRKSRQKTRTVKKSMNPVFNHTMVYDGFQDEDMHEACVELTVWDQETFSNQFLGGLRLGLGGGMSYGKPVDWMDSREGEVAVWHNMITRPGEWTEALLPLRPDMVKSKAKK
ncbi:synaptotagmin-like protein 2 isoform X3 [Lampetra planeri]